MSSRTSRRQHTREGRSGVRGAAWGAVLFALAGVLLPTVPAQADEMPQISVANPRIAPEDQIQVVGRGFEPRQSITIEVCGAPDTTGSLTCSPMTAAFEAPLNGSFVEDLVMAAPTGACPCLIAVRIPGAPPVVTQIELLNHPVADRVQLPEIVVDSAQLTSVTGLASLFTGRARANLELEVRNVGAAKASPTLLLEVAPSGATTAGEPIDDPGIAGVEPGESASVSVPVEFGSVKGGGYVVTGYVVVGDMYAPVSAAASVRPWGLYLVAGGVLALVVWAVRRRRKTSPSTEAPGLADHRPTPAPPASPQAPGRRAARKSRVPALSMAEVARAASGATKAASEVIARARAAEQAERSEQAAVARAESDDREIASRLDALARSSEAAATAPSPPQRRSKDRGPAVAPAELIGPPRLERTPIDRPAWLPEPVPAELSLEPTSGLALDSSAAAAATAVVEAPGGAMAAALQARATAGPVPTAMPVMPAPLADASVVAEAMAAIAVHTAQAPARLPDPHAYVPPQRDRRAPKGGKRAAR